jgi:hypothetical protein
MTDDRARRTGKEVRRSPNTVTFERGNTKEADG